MTVERTNAYRCGRRCSRPDPGDLRQILTRLRLESRCVDKLIDLLNLCPNIYLLAELFLPSYANDFDAQELEHKQDPVHEIFLSEEDAADMLPK